MKFTGARWFQRREDYQPPTTPADSPFRQFVVKCLKCGSYRVRLTTEFDEASGETMAVLICQTCPQRERLKFR